MGVQPPFFRPDWQTGRLFALRGSDMRSADEREPFGPKRAASTSGSSSARPISARNAPAVRTEADIVILNYAFRGGSCL